jgi:flagellum-specific peptidoglycan hydrolase FlgJ
MVKKLFYLFILCNFLACNSSRVGVTPSQKPKISVIQTTKRPILTSNVKVSKPTGKNNQEVILSTSKTIVYAEVVEKYVEKYKDIAMSNMKHYGIPASIILAQGILESGAGKGDLALAGNNHFGIKCHVGWVGETVFHDDDASQECFRKYNDPADSYKDHSLFLTSRPRYSSLFVLDRDDYEAWARGLRAKGYATDPKYPEKLISYIERYNLHQYDTLVLGKQFVPKSKLIDSSKLLAENLYEVQKQETLYSISKKFNVTVDALKQKNNLTENAISIGQVLIIK